MVAFRVSEAGKGCEKSIAHQRRNSSRARLCVRKSNRSSRISANVDLVYTFFPVNQNLVPPRAGVSIGLRERVIRRMTPNKDRSVSVGQCRWYWKTTVRAPDQRYWLNPRGEEKLREATRRSGDQIGGEGESGVVWVL